MKKIFEDENHTTEFDFTLAKSVFEPHDLVAPHSEYISDVDFVVESEKIIQFLEYKNGNIVGALNPNAFVDKIKSGSLTTVLVKKFYGTLLTLLITDRNPDRKPIRYTCIIEGGKGVDKVMIKKLRNKVYDKLPFDYRSNSEIKVPIIEEFELLNLSEWNAKYIQYPIYIKSETEGYQK